MRRVARGVQPHQTDRGVDLVERAVGIDAQIVFLAAVAGAERSGAVVASARVDAIEDHHVPIPPTSLAPHRPDREHGDDDGDELQQHPQAHQLLRRVRRTAPHHVDQTKQKNQCDGRDRNRKYD